MLMHMCCNRNIEGPLSMKAIKICPRLPNQSPAPQSNPYSPSLCLLHYCFQARMSAADALRAYSGIKGQIYGRFMVVTHRPERSPSLRSLSVTLTSRPPQHHLIAFPEPAQDFLKALTG